MFFCLICSVGLVLNYGYFCNNVIVNVSVGVSIVKSDVYVCPNFLFFLCMFSFIVKIKKDHNNKKNKKF